MTGFQRTAAVTSHRDTLLAAAEVLDTRTGAEAAALADAFRKVAWALRLDSHLIGRVGYEELAAVAAAVLGEPGADDAVSGEDGDDDPRACSARTAPIPEVHRD